jgi:peptidylprolyl isomerase
MLATLLLSAFLACSKSEESKPADTPPAAATDEGAIPAPPDVAAPPADAQKTASGLAYKVLTPGTGTAHPQKQDTVEVNYTGWTTDGKMFDSSSKRKKAAKFPLKNVIPGWQEGMQLMVTGEKTRFWIPANLAYEGKPNKPQGMLCFDVELVSIKEGPKPIPAPEDVSAPPTDAVKTKTGLVYKIMTKGTGKEHPKADSRVVVDYTGWQQSNGEMFDSSVARGRPATFGLGGVIPGWTEGVQLLVVGDKARFWIPSDLAYGDTPKRPGAPSGPLTFDIELKEIKEPGAPGAGGPRAGGMPHPGMGPKTGLKPANPGAKGEKKGE